MFEEVGNIPGLLRTRLSYAQFLEQWGENGAADSLNSQTLAKAKEMGLYLPVG